MRYSSKTDGTLFDQLLTLFPESSKSTLRSWIVHRRIIVNGRRASRTDMIVPAGSSIELAARPLPHEGPLRIHYEDRYIIVIEKPSGLLSVAKETGMEPSVHAWLKHRYPGKLIPVVHRLDQDTSGLMVFGLTREAFAKLKEALQHGEVRRVYRAVVEGHLEGKGTWESYLLEDRSLKMQVVPKGTKGAERAVTHYSSLKAGEVYSLIDCTLETGKKNQIRVQAAHAGHPIVGDKKYGGPREERLCLHAHTLTFTHPVTGAPMTFSRPPPLFFDRLSERKKRRAESSDQRAEAEEVSKPRLVDERRESAGELPPQADTAEDQGRRDGVKASGGERRRRRIEYWANMKIRNEAQQVDPQKKGGRQMEQGRTGGASKPRRQEAETNNQLPAVRPFRRQGRPPSPNGRGQKSHRY